MMTRRVVIYAAEMARWEPGARERLEQAALELFVEQGFADTTVPQITARAGLTTRTFFRHFSDKREVLFGVEQDLPALVGQLMADAPASLRPMALIEQGLSVVASTWFEGQRDHLLTHRAVVATDASLRERSLQKQAIVSGAVRQGFRDRGLDELTSTLAAHVAVTVLDVAVDRWLDGDGEAPLTDLVRDTLHELRGLLDAPG